MPTCGISMPSNQEKFPSARTATGIATTSASIILASRCCSRRVSNENPDGSFFLQVAEERASIPVEDTPYVVKSMEDDGKGGFILILNDDTREALAPASLEVGADNVLYARVKGGTFRARFLRPAYYHLSGNFEADEREVFHQTWRETLSAKSGEPRRFHELSN